MIPVLIKLDVEGYETEVVRGAEQTLQNPQVKAVILERMGLGKRFGFDENLLHERLLQIGFRLFQYHPFERRLEQIDQPRVGNNLYLRDVGSVEKRIKSAKNVAISGSAI